MFPYTYHLFPISHCVANFFDDFFYIFIFQAELQTESTSDAEPETVEIPVNPSSYRMLTNVCDLTATVLSLPDLPCSSSWLSRVLITVSEEIKRRPNVTGYLRIAHAALKAVKSSDDFRFRNENKDKIKDLMKVILQ